MQLLRQTKLSADEAYIKRQEIILLGQEEGKSNAEIGLDVELAGLELPFTLKAMITAELSVIEPPEPDGGMTDDDLEAEALAYAAELAGEESQLEEKREAVDKLRADTMAEKSSS